jgi:hypothetical protein
VSSDVLASEARSPAVPGVVVLVVMQSAQVVI